MKDLITGFSWDRLINLPPTEFLAFVVLVFLFLVLVGAVIAFAMALTGN